MTGNGGIFFQGVQGKGGGLRQTTMGGDEGRGTEARERSGALGKTWTVMSACPRDSSNTKPSSRRSGTCLLCRLFSGPPPRTLGDTT